MKYSIELNHFDDLKKIIIAKPDQVILGLAAFSKGGNLSIEQAESIYKKMIELEIPVVFSWDVLMTQQSYEVLTNLFTQFSFYKTIDIRLQDPGLLRFVYQKLENNIEIVLDWGNHNLFAIKEWYQYSSTRLKKIILSSQLTYSQLKNVTDNIDSEFELLGIGRPLIFYSPRSLLKPLFKFTDDYMEITSDGEETSHRNFPVKETKAGTLMYFSKIISLVSEIEHLEEIKITQLRVDVDYIDQIKHLKNRNFNIFIGKNTIKGFYKVNKTKVLFKKLKNQLSQGENLNSSEDQSTFKLGTIVDVRKKEYMVLKLDENQIVKVNDSVEFFTPDRKHKNFKIKMIKSLNLTNLEESHGHQYIILCHLNGISNKSVCYHSINK